MKKIILYITVAIITTISLSCEKDIMGYEGEEGVYFAVRHGDGHRAETSWPYQPYSDVDFIRINQDETEVNVKVSITGPVKEYDRVFYLEVNPDSTTAILGQHYQAISREWTVLAGTTETDVKVRLLRAADLEEMPRTLGLRLLPTADFTLSFPEWDAIPSLDGGATTEEFDASLHTLRINDVMVQPAEWSGSIQDGNRESGLFGVFSRRKMEFMTEYLGVTYEDFATPESMPLARMMLLSNDGAAVLVRLFNENTPVLEEDGRLMWMGTVPWNSFIGVPYVAAP